MKKCDRSILLSHFLKNQEAHGCAMKMKKNDYPSKIFLMEGRSLRMRQNNGANKLSDVRDMDSTVNKGTNS